MSVPNTKIPELLIPMLRNQLLLMPPRHYLFLLIVLLLSIAAQAQIVNIEDQRGQSDTVGLFSRADLSAALTENTRRLFQVSGQWRSDWYRPQAQWLLLGHYNFLNANGERLLDDGYAHLRYGRPLRKAWTWEAFGQWQFNSRLGIEQRLLLGTGPRYQFNGSDRWDLAVGALYMYERNDLDQESITRRDHRLSIYLTAKWHLNEQVRLASTTYYQPLLDNLAESRVSTITTLELRMSSAFAFTSSFNLTYDDLLARRLVGIPTMSYSWRNGIRVVF